jgi:hypothetical protein
MAIGGRPKADTRNTPHHSDFHLTTAKSISKKHITLDRQDAVPQKNLIVFH